jgi:general stress protein 26
MDVTSFDEIREEFLQRVNRVVWCNVATQDTRGRIRSRIMHPIWEAAATPIGWIATRRNTLKTRHLELHPFVSLAYVAEIAKPVYIDCQAEWDDTNETKQRVWNLFLTTPEPLGYDPAPIFQSIDNPEYGILRLVPWRVEVRDVPQPGRVWRDTTI